MLVKLLRVVVRLRAPQEKASIDELLAWHLFTRHINISLEWLDLPQIFLQKHAFSIFGELVPY
jgi:hypothetical protein